MILMTVCALLGALLGLFVKPRWLGVAIAVTLVAAVECGHHLMLGVLVDQPNREHLIAQLQAVFGESPLDAAGPVAATLVAGLLAAVMARTTDRDRPAPTVSADGIRRQVGKDGRYARLDGMVAEREVHAKAENRIDKILGL